MTLTTKFRKALCIPVARFALLASSALATASHGSGRSRGRDSPYGVT